MRWLNGTLQMLARADNRMVETELPRSGWVDHPVSGHVEGECVDRTT